MNDFHGIIFAYSASPMLRELVSRRTAASLMFCGRYRLIDLSLSSMRNAGIHDVGVIMQRDYQSLLDHLGSGKAWDMSRQSGGLRMLPPFGLADDRKGEYDGTMEALNSISTYIYDIKQKYVVLTLGCLCANIDLNAAMEQHISSGAEITAICTDGIPCVPHKRYTLGADGTVAALLPRCETGGEGVASLESYIINRDTLITMMENAKENGLVRFHKDSITDYLARGGRIDIYMHKGYSRIVRTVDSYYRANMDMLDAALRRDIFPKERPVLSPKTEGVSTYYAESACVTNSLIGDNCIIEGKVKNSIVFPGCRIAADACVSDSIIMSDCFVAKNSVLEHVISDKQAMFSSGTRLEGTESEPIVLPKYYSA